MSGRILRTMGRPVPWWAQVPRSRGHRLWRVLMALWPRPRPVPTLADRLPALLAARGVEARLVCWQLRGERGDYLLKLPHASMPASLASTTRADVASITGRPVQVVIRGAFLAVRVEEPRQ